MGRIRTVKPEFFTSPDTAKASVEARLFYIALWCWADDWGVGESNLNALLGFAFPEDDQRERKEVQSLCKEVADAYGILFYESNGRHFYQIPAWDEHQKTQRRAKRRNPEFVEGVTPLDPRIYGEKPATQGTSEYVQGSSESMQGNDREGTGEREQGKGNRGTVTLAQTSGSSVQHQNRFDEFWDAYPRKVGKQKARTDYRRATTRAPEQTIINGARRLASDPNLPETQYIPHPTTWLNRDGWEDEPLPAKTRGHENRAQQGLELARKYAQAEQEQEYHQIEAQ